MAKDDFSFRRFFHLAHAGSATAGVIIALVAGPAAGPAEMTMRGVTGAICGLMLSGCFYIFLVSKDLASLQVPDEELYATEVVLLKTSGSMVHFKSGRPLRFWEGVGGRLFLTSEVLEFRPHRGQPWLYCLTIPLSEIAQVVPCRILGLFSGGLRVERTDGSFELFSFGALRRDNDSATWVWAMEKVLKPPKQAGS